MCYEIIEQAMGLKFYFATPHHVWEYGTNANTNGLIRQSIRKGASMAKLTQHECNVIATKLNPGPRKRWTTKPYRCASIPTDQCCSSNLTLGGFFLHRARVHH